MSTSALVGTPDGDGLPPMSILWDEDVPADEGEEPMDIFLARQLLRRKFPDFDGRIGAYVLVALFGAPDGTRSVAQCASKHTHYAVDRGLLETALDEYRSLGVIHQLPEDDDAEED